MRHDRVYVFGQAKSHCVLSTLLDMQRTIAKTGPRRSPDASTSSTDAMSPVPPPPLDPLPPALDFPAVARARARASSREFGMNVVTTMRGMRGDDADERPFLRVQPEDFARPSVAVDVVVLHRRSAASSASCSMQRDEHAVQGHVGAPGRLLRVGPSRDGSRRGSRRRRRRELARGDGPPRRPGLPRSARRVRQIGPRSAHARRERRVLRARASRLWSHSSDRAATPSRVRWCPVTEAPELAFDHDAIIEDRARDVRRAPRDVGDARRASCPTRSRSPSFAPPSRVVSAARRSTAGNFRRKFNALVEDGRRRARAGQARDGEQAGGGLSLPVARWARLPGRWRTAPQQQACSAHVAPRDDRAAARVAIPRQGRGHPPPSHRRRRRRARRAHRPARHGEIGAHPHVREAHPGALLRVPPHALHRAERDLRPGRHRRVPRGALRPPHRGHAARQRDRLPRRGLQVELGHPQRAAHAAERAQVHERRPGAQVPAPVVLRRDQRGPERRDADGDLRPLPPPHPQRQPRRVPLPGSAPEGPR